MGQELILLSRAGSIRRRCHLSVLVVSDVHFEMGQFHGTDEYTALEWLLSNIKRFKPSGLVGLGDWGTAWKEEDWTKVTRLVEVHGIYGNHDNVGLLSRIKNQDGSPVLARDGEVRTLENLKFGFINGIIAENTLRMKPVPRKTRQDFLRCARALKGVDVLCTHESPLVPGLQTRIHPSVGTTTMGEVLETVSPQISLSGHVGKGFIVSKLGSILSVIIDSSQTSKHFIVLDPSSSQITVHNDRQTVETVTFSS